MILTDSGLYGGKGVEYIFLHQVRIPGHFYYPVPLIFFHQS